MPLTIITTNTTNSRVPSVGFNTPAWVSSAELMRRELRRQQEADEQWHEMTRRHAAPRQPGLSLWSLILLVLLDDEPTGPSDLLGCAPATRGEIWEMIRDLDRRPTVYVVGDERRGRDEVDQRCGQMIDDGFLQVYRRHVHPGREVLTLTVRGLAAATELAIKLKLVDNDDEVPT